MRLTEWGRTRLGKTILSAAAAAALVFAGMTAFGTNSSRANTEKLPELGPATRDTAPGALPESGTFAPLVKETAPAVVSIQAERVVRAPEMPEGFPWPFFFGPEREQPERRRPGIGSGVIVSPDGYILTNHHVVDEAENIKVILLDEREFPAKVVGSDAKTDVAVLKVEASNLPTLKLGNSDVVEVGDIVLAIGNPFGVGQTVTMGIVGATGRAFGILLREGGYEDFIQTDAAINPGNSGGPLINAHGQVVGINTAILSRSGASAGVGFAIPVNLAHMVMTQLVEKGRVVRGYMGVGIQDVSQDLREQLEAPDSRGAVVSSVEPGSPADKAGFKRYDIIRSIDGRPVQDARQLRLAVASKSPGTSLNVAVLRDGKEQNLRITLGELPSGDEDRVSQAPGAESVLSGVQVSDLTPDVARRLGVETGVQGVVVTRVAANSPAARAGLRSGDVIEEVARRPVTSVDEFRRAVREASGDSVLLLVHRQGGSVFVVVGR